eukprot:GHUV01021586.1.p1 GENE.GHUV01021586.1~~GHUV01021586.1.p1  ORF type:complete len:101 (+),score=10.03 GHUV01021586.1:227-529(+)
MRQDLSSHFPSLECRKLRKAAGAACQHHQHTHLTDMPATPARLSTGIIICAGLRTLNLRQNILPDVAPLDSCKCQGTLEDLEVRDNLLTEVRDNCCASIN